SNPAAPDALLAPLTHGSMASPRSRRSNPTAWDYPGLRCKSKTGYQCSYTHRHRNLSSDAFIDSRHLCSAPYNGVAAAPPKNAMSNSTTSAKEKDANTAYKHH